MTIKQSDRSNRRSRIPIPAYAPYALLIVAVLLAYANVYHNDFVYDDQALIRDNKFLTSWRYIGTLLVSHLAQASGQYEPFYRPLQLTLYLFVYQAAGLSTVAFHLLNVTLHALNACLIYTLGVRLGFQRIASMLASLFWALHPVHTEAVTYVSGTADLLYSTFLLSGTLVLASDFSRRNILAACLLFVLALLSKEAAVVFPMLAMGLLFYHSENRWSPKTYLKTWPFWLLAVLYLIARETVLNFNGFFGYYHGAILQDRFYTFLATLPTYLRLLLWPTSLHMERHFPIYTTLWPPPVMVGLAMLMALITGIIWKPSRRATPLAWGILWAGVVFIPVSGVIAPNDALIYEHWLYLPMAGLGLGLGESLARLSGNVRTLHLQPVLAVMAVPIACLLGIMTFQQNKIWRDSIVLYQHIFDCGDDSSRVRYNLGLAYSHKGQYELAIAQYRIALTMLDDAETHYFLGANLVNLYHDNPALRDEGIEHLKRALELQPDYYKAADALAHVYEYIGDRDKTTEYRFKAAAIRQRLGLE